MIHAPKCHQFIHAVAFRSQIFRKAIDIGCIHRRHISEHTLHQVCPVTVMDGERQYSPDWGFTVFADFRNQLDISPCSNGFTETAGHQNQITAVQNPCAFADCPVSVVLEEISPRSLCRFQG